MMRHTVLAAVLVAAAAVGGTPKAPDPDPPASAPYKVYPLPQSRPAAHYDSPYKGMRASGSHKAIGGSGLIDGKAR